MSAGIDAECPQSALSDWPDGKAPGCSRLDILEATGGVVVSVPSTTLANQRPTVLTEARISSAIACFDSPARCRAWAFSAFASVIAERTVRPVAALAAAASAFASEVALPPTRPFRDRNWFLLPPCLDVRGRPLPLRA